MSIDTHSRVRVALTRAGGRSFVAAVTLAALAASAMGAVVLNEVAYDPDGPDAGAEYVELMNTGFDAAVLDGRWQLERGNGAAPDDWSVVWEGSGERLPAGGRLVIGDDPRSDIPRTLGLQNGPDACRLRVDGRVVDLLGWGAHTHGGYAEGRPAPDPSPGLLARRPDGADTDDNAADWVPADRATPGATNFPDRFVSLMPSFPATAPVLAEPGRALAVRLVARNGGLGALGADVRIEARLGTDVVGSAALPELVPGADRTLELPIDPLGPGSHAVPVTAVGVEHEGASVAIRIGLPEVVVTEVRARPRPDEPEWIELLWRSDVETPAVVTIRDAAGAAVAVPVSGPRGSRVVLTTDSARLLGTYPALDATDVREVGLPSLNDTGDVLYLVDAAGAVIDAVSWSGASEGASLERVSPDEIGSDPSMWVDSPLGPTPGRTNGARADPPRASGLGVEPRVVTGTSDVAIVYAFREAAGRVRLELFRLDGRGRGLIAERRGHRGVVRWNGTIDGRSLSPGLYVVVATHLVDDRVRGRERASLAVSWR